MPYNLNKRKEWESEQYAIFQSQVTNDLLEVQQTLSESLEYAKKQNWAESIISNIEVRLDIIRRILLERGV